MTAEERNATFVAAAFRWQRADGRWWLTIVCRRSYELLPGCCVASEQQTLPADQPRRARSASGIPLTDHSGLSLWAASDQVPFKSAVDVVVVGSAYAPGANQARRVSARVQIGALDKTAFVACEPGWTGQGSVIVRGRCNGLGYASEAATPTSVWRPHPEVSSDHESVFALVDESDIDCFNSVTADQRLAVLNGHERLTLEGLDPKHAILTTRLPGERPIALIVRAGVRETLALRCDTLWIDSDQQRCALVWRGNVALGSSDEALQYWVVDGATSAATIQPAAPPAEAPPESLDAPTNAPPPSDDRPTVAPLSDDVPTAAMPLSDDAPTQPLKDHDTVAATASTDDTSESPIPPATPSGRILGQLGSFEQPLMLATGKPVEPADDEAPAPSARDKVLKQARATMVLDADEGGADPRQVAVPRKRVDTLLVDGGAAAPDAMPAWLRDKLDALEKAQPGARSRKQTMFDSSAAQPRTSEDLTTPFPIEAAGAAARPSAFESIAALRADGAAKAIKLPNTDPLSRPFTTTLNNDTAPTTEPTPEPEAEPIALESYAAIQVALWDSVAPLEALAPHALDELAWREQQRLLQRRIAEQANDGSVELANALRRAMAAAEEERAKATAPPPKEVDPADDLDSFVTLRLSLDRSEDDRAVLDSQGLSHVQWNRIQRSWAHRARADEELAQQLQKKLAAGRSDEKITIA